MEGENYKFPFKYNDRKFPSEFGGEFCLRLCRGEYLCVGDTQEKNIFS